MRRIIGAAAFMAIALTAAPATAHDYPYCLQGRDWGYPGNCQFTYLWQCEATAAGTMDGSRALQMDRRSGGVHIKGGKPTAPARL